MIWQAVAPVLQSMITGLALQTADAFFQGGEWSNQRHAFVEPGLQMQLELRITSSAFTARGTNYQDNGDGTSSAVMGGMRDFILNVQAKSYDQAYDHWAHEYAERIRTRIFRDSVQATLAASSIVVWDAADILDLPGVEDGQATSVASLDLKCRAGFLDDAEIVPYFASVALVGTISGTVSGVPYTIPITAP